MDFINDFVPAEYQSSKISNIGDVLGVAINVVLGAAMAASIIGLILSGIKYMTTRSGDPRQLEGAKKALTYSIVAMILSVGAFAILNIILSALGGNVNDTFTG